MVNLCWVDELPYWIIDRDLIIKYRKLKREIRCRISRSFGEYGCLELRRWALLVFRIRSGQPMRHHDTSATDVELAQTATAIDSWRKRLREVIGRVIWSLWLGEAEDLLGKQLLNVDSAQSLIPLRRHQQTPLQQGLLGVSLTHWAYGMDHGERAGV
jgi:hypothetical protein